MINKNYLNMLGLANAARALVNGETLIKSISANKVATAPRPLSNLPSTTLP